MAQLEVGNDPSEAGKQINIPDIPADTIMNNLLDMVYFAAGITAVVAIIIAGYMYTTARGNTEKTSNARRLILYSSAGLVVVFAAFMITAFITGRF